MRIQHNIMAMNAYRNYSNNISAMKKNLERLSSGYKINRAGDDAAGLAISEKMRAQITGLETASKNAKDGISLVQTAEGALTEVHDMLNRMVELATQSANGTYDNDTDRLQLQKEMDQLKAEINRIADSANFNGIKLLDGSMDTSAINGVTYNYVSDSKMKAIFGAGNWDNDDFWKGKTQPDISGGSTGNVGATTKLETEGGASSRGGFQISLDGIGEVTLAEGDVFKLEIGGSEGYSLEFTVGAGEGGAYTAAKLVQKLMENKADSSGWGSDGTFTGFQLKDTEGNVRYFDISAGADGKTLVFTAVDDQKDFKLYNSATVTWYVNEDEGGIPEDASYMPDLTLTSNPSPATTVTGKAPTVTQKQGAAAAGSRVADFGNIKPGQASIASIASFASITANMATMANHLATLASASITIGSNTLTWASIGLGTTASAVLDDLNEKLGTEYASFASISKADFEKYLAALLEETFTDINNKASGTTSTYAEFTVSFGTTGFDVSFTETPYIKAAASQGAIFELDFSGVTGLTGSTVINTTFTIGSLTFEFIASGASPSGNADHSIVISKSATASGVAKALYDYLKENFDTIASKAHLASTASAALKLESGKLTLTGAKADTDFTVGATPGQIEGPESGGGVASEVGSTGGKIGIVFGENVTVTASASAGLQALLAGGTITASMAEGLFDLFNGMASAGIINVPIMVDGSIAGYVDVRIDALIKELSGSFANSFTAASLGQLIADTVTEALRGAGVDDKLAVEWVALDSAGTNKIYEDTTTQFKSAAVPSGVEGIFIKIGEKSVSNGNGGGGGGTTNLSLQNVTNNNSGEAAGLANTVVDFGVDGVNAWQDGAKITIGDTTYTVALGEGSKFKNVTNVIDLTDINANDPELAKKAAEKLSEAAKNNSIFTVGAVGDGRISLQQRSEVKDSTDMSTKEKLASYLGVSIADADSIENAKPGHALTLQIGDTAHSYNQLSVSISDTHTYALGLDGISIADQDSAALAIDKIKAAINTVSDIRGTLGATQNRLDHTINNLSVMTENIQDAESTIRDTDIAEEMMAYTKNNILIQAAQAMLAQANQVPQGVLQLLQ